MNNWQEKSEEAKEKREIQPQSNDWTEEPYKWLWMNTPHCLYVLVKWWNEEKNSKWNFIIFLPGKWNHSSSFEDWIGFSFVFHSIIVNHIDTPFSLAFSIQHSVFGIQYSLNSIVWINIWYIYMYSDTNL